MITCAMACKVQCYPASCCFSSHIGLAAPICSTVTLSITKAPAHGSNLAVDAVAPVHQNINKSFLNLNSPANLLLGHLQYLLEVIGYYGD